MWTKEWKTMECPGTNHWFYCGQSILYLLADPFWTSAMTYLEKWLSTGIFFPTWSFFYSHTLLIECPYVAAPGDPPHEVAVTSYSVVHLPLHLIVYLHRQLSHFWWNFHLLMVSWVSLSFIFTLFWHTWLENVGVIHACGERSDRWGLAGSELFALDLPNSMFYAITARALRSSFYVGTYLVLSYRATYTGQSSSLHALYHLDSSPRVSNSRVKNYGELWMTNWGT